MMEPRGIRVETEVLNKSDDVIEGKLTNRIRSGDEFLGSHTHDVTMLPRTGEDNTPSVYESEFIDIQKVAGRDDYTAEAKLKDIAWFVDENWIKASD